MFGVREGVSEGVIDPAPDELPGPQNLDGLFWGAIKGVGKGGLGGIDIDSSVEPAGDQASDIASELGGGNAAAPRGEDVRGKVAEGGGGFRPWLGAGLFVGRGIRGSSPPEATMHSDGGSMGDPEIAEGKGGADWATGKGQVEVGGQGEVGAEVRVQGSPRCGVGKGDGVKVPREVEHKKREWGGRRWCGRERWRQGGRGLGCTVDVESVDVRNVCGRGGWSRTRDGGMWDRGGG